MTSLSEAYDGRGGSSTSLRRLYLGVGLFVGGTLLVVAGIISAGTSVATALGYSLADARLWGGVLGGVGVPAVMLGVFTVLPSGRTTKAAAGVGVSLSLFAVALFDHAYPNHWIGGPNPELIDLTLPTAGIYFLGIATTFWCLFVGIANFKTRNDPGGTVEMEVTHKGETKIVEVERDNLSGFGGIGFLGNTPDGNVETQTNVSTGATPAASSDGGSEDDPISSPLEQSSTTQSASAPSTESVDEVGDGGSSTGRARTQGSTAPESTRTTGSTPGPTGGTRLDSDGSMPSPQSSGSTSQSQSQRSTSTTGSAGGSESRRSGDDTAADHYCGSCEQFRYVRTEDGMQPYCELDEEFMESMDACEDWTPR